MSFVYQWEQCGRGGKHAECTAIAGARSASYRAATQQIRHQLRVLVTATNSVGTGTVVSRSTKRIKEGAPLNLAPPEIAGNITEGSRLSASTGTWVGTPPFSFSYQWERCSLASDSCESISGATESTYTPTVHDLTSRLAVTVTARNFRGTASATSPETLPVEALLPMNIIPPSITGVLTEGQLLSVSPGSWSGSEPFSYSYAWLKCDAAGEGCEELKGASGSSLELVNALLGDALEVVVTAKNVAGSASATSAVTGVVKGIAPVNVSLPTISGELLAGKLLTAAPGKWTGSEPITYAYQWQLCSLLTEVCEVTGSTGSTLKLGLEDIGAAIDVFVTAKNVAGTSSAESSLTGEILS